MIKTANILLGIQTRTGFSRKDKHQLYQYRVTVNELEQLRCVLSETIAEHGELNSPDDCAAFCLFGSEWFRRNYIDGVWSWETIYDGLGWQDHAIERLSSNITKVVGRGLKWWGIEVIRLQLSRRFLGTIVCQGGVPIAALRRENGALTRCLRSSLRSFERSPDRSIRDITDENVFMLPQSLANSDFQFLLGELVRAIAKLRSVSDEFAKSGINRKQYLDQYRPKWADELPLRVEEPEALELIVSMLDASKARKFQDGQLGIVTRLDDLGNSLRLVQELEFPSLLSEEALLQQFSIRSRDELAPRMTCFLSHGGRDRAALTLCQERNTSNFRLSKLDRTSTLIYNNMESVRLELRVGGSEIGNSNVVGGNALPLPETPWCFSDREPRELIATGGARTKDTSMLVAVPDGCKFECSAASSLEWLSPTLAGRRVAKLSGAGTVHTEDGDYRITTKTQDVAGSTFEIAGKLLWLGVEQGEIWQGMPSIYEVTIEPESSRTQVLSRSIQWRSVHSREWQPLSTDCIGEVRIRVVKEGVIQFARVITVLPESVSINVVPDTKAKSSGILEIRNLGAANLDFEKLKGVDIQVESAGVLCRVSVSTDGSYPGALPCRVRFANRSQCTLNFVCPTTSMQLVDVANRLIPNNAPIPVDKLGGVRLRVIRPSNGARRLSVMEKANWQFMGTPVATRVPGVYEFQLGTIATYASGILSQNEEPDTTVAFEVRSGDATATDCRWRVSRYSKRFERPPNDAREGMENTAIFTVSDELRNEILAGTESLKLDVRPMHSISTSMPANSMEFSSEGLVRIDHTDYPSGYYLLVAHLQSNGEVLRPIRFAVKRSDILKLNLADVTNQSDHFAVALNTQDTAQRKQKWKRFCSDIGDDPTHPGWAKVDEVLECSKSLGLPITTFEMTAALAGNFRAVVRTAFVRAEDRWFWSSIEELPFMWSLVPIAKWIQGAHQSIGRLRLILTEANIEAEEIEKCIAKQIQVFSTTVPQYARGLGTVLAGLFETGIKIPPLVVQHLYDPKTLMTRDFEKSRTIAQHDKYDSRTSWPNERLALTDFAMSKLKSIQGLEIKDRFQNEWSIWNAPAITAIYCLYHLEASGGLVRDLKRLRGVDPEWFSVANACAMQMIFEFRLKENGNCFKEMLGVNS